MKKLVLAIAFIGMGSFVMAQQSPLTAQQKADRQAKKTEMHDKRMSKMQQELGLTDSQVAQINALQDKRKGEMKANMQAQTADRRAQNQAANDEMKRILTPDQYTKWQANRQAKMDQRKEMMKNRRMDNGGMQKIQPAKAN
jgi:Spy/CpxP family protein refolding chaperone